MQSMAVLLLELSYHGSRTPAVLSDIPAYIKKLVRWFRALRVTDAVASRAYDIVVRILEDSNPIFQTVASQILADDEDRGPEYEPSVLPPDLHETSPSLPTEEAGAGPGGSYATYYPEANLDPLHSPLEPFGPHSFPALVDPLGQPQTVQHPAQQQVQPQDDFFSFTSWVTNPSAYTNPFSTSFDQPNLLGIPDLWSLVGASSGESQTMISAPAEPNEDEYQAYGAQHQGPLA
jgi:hypothetical protein